MRFPECLVYTTVSVITNIEISSLDRLRFSWAAMIVFYFWGTSSFAQTSQITGTIRDLSGAGVANASVRLTRSDTGTEAACVSPARRAPIYRRKTFFFVSYERTRRVPDADLFLRAGIWTHLALPSYKKRDRPPLLERQTVSMRVYFEARFDNTPALLRDTLPSRFLRLVEKAATTDLRIFSVLMR